MKLSELKNSGHLPTLIASFLYFDVSFMIWTILGPLGVQIGKTLNLTEPEKGLMVAVPILAGAILRIVLGVTVDHLGAKATGIVSQLIVIVGLGCAWQFGLHDFQATLLLGFVLGFAGASFAVALPQAGRWYPPNMQGLVMGLAGAGNIGTVIDALIAPNLAKAYGWQNVFGIVMIPAVLILVIYVIFSKEAPITVKKKQFSDYVDLLKQRDSYWFCFFYLISFGGFVGLASSYVLYFKGEFAIAPVNGTWLAGAYLAAACTATGALLRPVGGAFADRIGGIRSLSFFYAIAAAGLVVSGLMHSLYINFVALMIVSAGLGMANGAVFQLLPQRFAKDIGVMTGLVGAAGGIGGFYLASSLGYSKGITGHYSIGLFVFAGLCVVALAGLTVVKTRWRTTWGAVAAARI
jgi:NNP family nitrate/nitrite transporter-like MFS transporter